MGADEISFWPRPIHLALFMMLSLAFTGCAKLRVEEVPRSGTGIEAGDCITVVLVYQGGSPQKAEKIEKSIGDCISGTMVKRNLSVRFIPPGEFRRAVFPDTDITSAPRPRAILGLLSSPQFRDKIKSLNLRYLITVRERTELKESLIGDPILYSSLLISHDKSTVLVANIIDLQKKSDSGEVRVTAEDTGAYGCVCIFPVVVPAFTESRACKTLGRAVTKFLMGD